MHKNFYRVNAVLSFVALALCLVSTASASTVQIVFGQNPPPPPGYSSPNSAQTFDSTLDFSANVNTTASGFTPTTTIKGTKIGGPFALNPNPQSLSLGFFGGPQTGSGNPVQIGTSGTMDVTNTGLGVGALVDTKLLDIDLLNGATIPTGSQFFLDTITLNFKSLLTPPFILPPLLSPLTIDAGGSIQTLTFLQTGLYSFTPTGLNSGTFSVDGNLTVGIPDLSLSISSGLITTDIPTTLTTALALTGTYKVTGPVSNTKIQLDGNLLIGQPFALVTGLQLTASSPPLTIDASIDLQATFLVAVNYHLEQSMAIPEPGSVVLLLIGTASLVPLATHWVRKRRRA